MHSTNHQSSSRRKPMSYKCFKVKVKLGHVSRRKYLPMDLPIKARSIQEAVAIARSHGGVKSDHPNWCLEKPVVITYEEFLQLEQETYSDPYWQGKTRSQIGLFADRLVDEDDAWSSDLDYHKNKRVRAKHHSGQSRFLEKKNKLENRLWKHIEKADTERLYY
jgi:hypothetical protein